MKNIITMNVVKLALVIIMLITLASCQKPPVEGCLDKSADNYNANSEDNCCCKYHFDVEFQSDTLNVAEYMFYIGEEQVGQRSSLPATISSYKTTTYHIYKRSDSSLVNENVINLYRGKNNIIKF